jgi:hypothetical protein
MLIQFFRIQKVRQSRQKYVQIEHGVICYELTLNARILGYSQIQ